MYSLEPLERFGWGARTLLLALLLPLSPAFAQKVRPLPVDDMTRQSDVVGVATVISAIPHLEERNGFVYTDFRLNFSEVWKGQASPEFILMKPGGTAQGIKGSIPGHEYKLNPGEKVVVFASPSNLGNHVVVGIHQGLYRIGKEANAPLYRVTQYPFGPGKDSDVTLQALKDEVYRSLGKPVESRPSPDGATPPRTIPDKRTDPPEAPPKQDATSPAPTVTPPDGTPRWIGLLIICVFLTAVLGVLFWKRKSPSRG